MTIQSKIEALSSYLDENNLKLESKMVGSLLKLAGDCKADEVHVIPEGSFDSKTMTLGGISLMFDVPLSLILSCNGMTEETVLRPGMEIKIPKRPSGPNSSGKFPSDALFGWIKVEEGGGFGMPTTCPNGEVDNPGCGEPYLCSYDDGSGNLTIGYGRNQQYQTIQKISRERALKYLNEAVHEAANKIKNSVSEDLPDAWTIPVQLTTNEGDALTSLIFNAGGGGYITSDLHKTYIKTGLFRDPEHEGEFRSAFLGFRSKNPNQKGIPERRLREWEIFKNANYEPKPCGGG